MTAVAREIDVRLKAESFWLDCAQDSGQILGESKLILEYVDIGRQFFGTYLKTEDQSFLLN